MKLSDYVTLIAASSIWSAAALPTSVNSVANSSDKSSLSLKGLIEPVNNTHIKVAIANTYSQDISILKWNSHFQARAEHNSFVIKHDVNRSKQALEQGPYMLNYRLATARPSHFVNIIAGGLYTGYFDLTDLFDVPEAGSYSVTMNLQTPAFLHSRNSTLEQALSHSASPAQRLQSLHIYSSPVTMHLVISESAASRISKRQDGPRPAFPGDCFGGGSSSDPESIVRAAYLEAKT